LTQVIVGQETLKQLKCPDFCLCISWEIGCCASFECWLFAILELLQSDLRFLLQQSILFYLPAQFCNSWVGRLLVNLYVSDAKNTVALNQSQTEGWSWALMAWNLGTGLPSALDLLP
jgi:hypothetical protein